MIYIKSTIKKRSFPSFHNLSPSPLFHSSHSSFCDLFAESGVLRQAFSTFLEHYQKQLLLLSKKIKRVLSYKLCNLALDPANKPRKEELWDEPQKGKSSNKTRKDECLSSFYPTTTSFCGLSEESSTKQVSLTFLKHYWKQRTLFSKNLKKVVSYELCKPTLDPSNKHAERRFGDLFAGKRSAPSFCGSSEESLPVWKKQLLNSIFLISILFFISQNCFSINSKPDNKIYVNSKTLEVDYARGIAEYKTNVFVQKKGNFDLYCDRAKIFSVSKESKKNNANTYTGKIKHIELYDNITIIKDTKIAKGDSGVIYPKKNLIILIGKVQLKEKTNTKESYLEGNKVKYYIDKEIFKMSNSQQERVKVILNKNDNKLK